MKVTILGCGSFGSTLGQILNDNKHEVLLYDINENLVNKFNNDHLHPFFDGIKLPDNLKATTNLEEAINYSKTIFIILPTKYIRDTLKKINPLLKDKKIFINGSKGLEPDTFKRVSEIVDEEINKNYLEGFGCISGPAHAEELVLRKVTLMVSASKNQSLAKKIQHLLNNDSYLRMYTSNDLIGVELCAAIKNAIAVSSGAITGLGYGENTRAALISRGLLEMLRIVEKLGGKRQTVFGLTGLGDLIVTASSMNSRNFRAGKKIGEGYKIDEILKEEKQTIEGFRTIEACHNLKTKYNLSLPIIEASYEVIFNNKDINKVFPDLLKRELKSE